jgi:hypothetical protein
VSRITLRILASKSYSEAQKRFVGLLRQDPCDPNLKLVYGLELLWRHTLDDLRLRRISAIAWNPVNDALLAVGYTSPIKSVSIRLLSYPRRLSKSFSSLPLYDIHLGHLDAGFTFRRRSSSVVLAS